VRQLPEIQDHLFLLFSQEIHEIPKEDKKNPYFKKYPSHDGFITGRKMAYLFSMESINPKLSVFSLGDKDTQQSGKGGLCHMLIGKWISLGN
jgi:hypothetical protein